MAITDNDILTSSKNQRKKMADVDNPIINFDQSTPNGRQYQSATFTSILPDIPCYNKTDRNMAMYGNDLMISVQVEPVEGEIPGLDNIPPYERQVHYFNRTNKHILVTDKHNITMTLPKSRINIPYQREHFIIRVIHNFNQSEIALSILRNHQAERSYLTVEDVERDLIISSITNAYNQGYFNNNSRSHRVTVDRIIPIALLQQYASIYVSDLDLLFRFEGTDIETPHPTSQDAVLYGETLDILKHKRISGMFYEIIDNESEYSTRYICLGTKVVQIPVNKNKGKESGIYMTHFENVLTDKLQITLERHPLDKSEDIGVYQTREEAETKGNLQKAFEIELAQQKREYEREKIENERLKIELHRVKEQRQEEIEKLTHERKRIELELQMQKNKDDHKFNSKEREEDIEARRVKNEYDMAQHARKMIELENSLSELKLQKQLSEQELLSKIEILKRTLELKEREHQLELEEKEVKTHYDILAKARDDYYQGRSYARKDTSEFVKWLPTITTGVIATGVLIYTKTSNKDRNDFDGI